MIRAALVASVWAACAFGSVMVALIFMTEGGSWRRVGRELDITLLIYLLICTTLTLVLSTAGHLLLALVGIRHAVAYWLAGAALGAAAGAIMTRNTNPGALIVICTTVGAFAAAGYHHAYFTDPGTRADATQAI